MSDPALQPAAAPPQTPALSQIQRVINIFSAPSKTFIDIRDHSRSWWMPFLIMVVVGYIFFAVVNTKIGMQQVVDNQNHLSPKAEERLAQATPEQREFSNKIAVGITEGVFIGNPILLLVIVAAGSLVLWGTINFVFGGKAKYGSIFAVWVFASLPAMIKPILGSIVIFTGMAPESFNIKNYSPTNLAALLMNPLETSPALYSLASSLDVVTVWTLVLAGIGTAIVAGVKRSSGYIAVFGWWAIIALAGAGLAAAFS
jgi:Yip1-like protein